ncbi:hypothetical protein [Massilia sp. YIM B02443]|uniref:hypothetical protein n=1 Tax=Massilia sp. YIM B02443 TaxID=3050127 RepID=UPI0025B63C32|nr:hypothetical protein [Massilia sp. YIM B02443]MDN4037544.1 hypothetical protein [Massilia sp. YIM B02443]
MLRTTPRLALLTLCLFAHAGFAAAQQTATQQQTPTQRAQPAAAATQPQARPAQQQGRSLQEPPQLERIEPGSDVPATTIEPRPRTRITEKRANDGQVTEVEVQSGPSRYIMKPNVAAGNAQPGDAQSSGIRAPQWQVMEFDFGNPKKQEAAETVNPAPARPGVPGRADAPPPPALEPTTKQ